MTFRPLVKVSWTDLYYEFYDGRQVTEMWPLHLVAILTWTGGLEPPLTEVSLSFCPIIVQSHCGRGRLKTLASSQV